MKILPHYPHVLPSKQFTILELFAKPFPTENGERKAKEAGRWESKR